MATLHLKHSTKFIKARKNIRRPGTRFLMSVFVSYTASRDLSEGFKPTRVRRRYKVRICASVRHRHEKVATPLVQDGLGAAPDTISEDAALPVHALWGLLVSQVAKSVGHAQDRPPHRPLLNQFVGSLQILVPLLGVVGLPGAVY